MYKYMLPDKNNNPVTFETENNSVIIIGANGSGKSKLGAWMEEQNLDSIHRIAAQRSLNFREFITLKSYEEAENLLFYGTQEKRNGKIYRWNQGKTTTLLNDYENVLSSLIAKNNLQNSMFVDECKKAEKEKRNHPPVPRTVIDDLVKIWDEVFPHRRISFNDSKVLTSFSILGSDGKYKNIEYKGNKMSDGERVALYLIAQCLSIPLGDTIIIDEPELHLHQSIMNKLWTEVEKIRQDCLFIYITHDTKFASNHLCSEKIWVKEYDGKHWELEKISDSTLPEQLLLDILGNRKNVLFVEGTNNSYDTKLYREIYSNYYVIPCGSCTSVINNVKTFNNTKQLHHLKCYGIIDRDFRSDYEIEKHAKNNIYCLKVAEVENLFIVPELLEYINKLLGNSNNDKVDDIKKYIIETKYLNNKKQQIYSALISQTKYELSCLDVSKDLDEILNNISKYIKYEELKNKVSNKYDSIKSIKQYKECLMIYNSKGLVNSIGHILGVKDEEYCEIILRKIKKEDKNEIIKALDNYLPKEIER